MTAYEYTRCDCGAVTVYVDGVPYSCKKKNLRRFFPGADLRRWTRVHLPTYCCDHCVNHYGLDLCACGSGEPFQTCQGGTKYCGKPMQKIGEYTSVDAEDAFVLEEHNENF